MRSWQPKMAYAAYRRVRWHKCFSRYLIVCCCDCCIVYLCDMERRIERYGVINGNVLTSLSLSLSLSVVFTFTKIFQYYLNTNTHAHASFMQCFFFVTMDECPLLGILPKYALGQNGHLHGTSYVLCGCIFCCCRFCVAKRASENP